MSASPHFNETSCRFILWVDRERGLRWHEAARRAGYKDTRGWIIAAADVLARRSRCREERRAIKKDKDKP